MTEDQYQTHRTTLANRFAAAGRLNLEFMGCAGTLAAIPNTEPQQYVAAGSISAIRAQIDKVEPQRRMRKGERPEHDLYFGPEAGQARRFAALITSSGHGLLQEYGTTFEHALPGQEVIEVVEMGAAPAIANKAAEEGELPVLHAPECLGMNAGGGGHVYGYTYEHVQEYARQAITADRAARPVANTRDGNEFYQSWLIADPSGAVERLRAAAQALLTAASKNIASGEVSEIAAAADAVDEALAASVGFVAPVANKAEVEPLTATHGPIHLTNRKTAEIASTDYNIIGYVLRREDGDAVCISAESAVRWLPEAHYWRLMHEQDGSLFATPPATTSASTVLTDEQIQKMWTQAYIDALAAAGMVMGNADEAHNTRPFHFARAIEREVGAQAGQVAVPGWISVNERLPDVPEDEDQEFIITCRRANGKSYVFAASYLSEKGVISDDDPATVFTGWYLRTEKDGYDGWFAPVCDQGDAVTYWMPLPASPASESLRSPQEAAGTEKGELTRCAAGRDGECGSKQCPQLRDNEPNATGRHCPLDNDGGGDA